MTPASPVGSASGIFRALRSRNVRLYFLGQGTSLVGSWMERMAMSWLVYRITGSAFLLGAVGFASQIPLLFLTPLAGVLADRYNRRRLLLATQSLLMVQGVIVALLSWSGAVRVWHLFVLGILFGVLTAIDVPTRQSFLSELVHEPEDLANAIALHASIVNGTRLLGPAFAGFAIAAVGETVCFALNAASFLAVLLALLLIRISAPAAVPERVPVFQGLREGFAYVAGFGPVLSILLLLAWVSLVGMPYGVLMPVFATTVLSGGPKMLGFLTAASGSGAMVGALYMAGRKTVLGLGRRMVYSAAAFGLGLAGFAYSHSALVSSVFLFLTGFAAMVMMAAANTVLQTVTPEHLRGRVMSFYVVALMGMAPFGSLLAGWLADRVGAPATVFGGGVLCLAAAALFRRRLPALKAGIWPIYAQKGLLPGVPVGVPPANY